MPDAKTARRVSCGRVAREGLLLTGCNDLGRARVADVAEVEGR